MENYQIFISYRRNGGEHLAGRLRDKLHELGYSVFYDVESMRSGDFNVQIYDAIDACSDVLLVLPPNGLDRCADENDWVRLELEHAIKKHKHIMPILMRNFVYPENLPNSLEGIKKLDGITAETEYFDAVIQKIAGRLKCKSPNGFGEKDLNNAKNEKGIALKVLSRLRDSIYTWRIFFYSPAAFLLYLISSFLLEVCYSQDKFHLPQIGELSGTVVAVFLVIAPTLSGIAMKIISTLKRMRTMPRIFTTIIAVLLITFICSVICFKDLCLYNAITIFAILIIPTICSILASFFTIVTRLFISYFISEIMP